MRKTFGSAILAVTLAATVGCGSVANRVIQAGTHGSIKANGNGSYTYSGPSGSVTVNANGTGGGTYTDSHGNSVQYGSNKLPDGWPSDVPVPSGVTITAGLTSQQSGGKNFTASFTSKDSAASVDSYYKDKLAGDGWTIASQGNYGSSYQLSATKDTRAVSVIISDHGAAGSTGSGTGVVLNVGPKPA